MEIGPYFRSFNSIPTMPPLLTNARVSFKGFSQLVWVPFWQQDNTVSLGQEQIF